MNDHTEKSASLASKPGDGGIMLPQDPIPLRELRGAVARALASRKAPDQVVNQIAEILGTGKLRPRDINVCTHGICIDYVAGGTLPSTLLQDIFRVGAGRVHKLEIFPWGIPFPDVFHVRVEQEIEGLGGIAAGPG